MKTIAIPFSGFYESAHTALIDQAVEQIFQDDNGEDHTPDSFHMAFGYTTPMLNAYCRDYVENFVEYLRDEFEIEIDLNFDHLYSPKYYNFETDRIFCEISREDIHRLAFAVNIRDLAHVIKERHSSRSGFISFYKNDLREWYNKPLDEWDCNELETLLLAVMRGYAQTPAAARYRRADANLDAWEIMERSVSNGVIDSIIWEHMSDQARAIANAFDREKIAA